MRAEPQIKISDKRVVSISLPWFIGLLGGTVTATMGWAALRADAQEAKVLAASTSARVTALESAFVDVAAMKRDVEWIKRTLDGDRNRSSRTIANP